MKERNFKRLLIVGGAGFIGSNFVRLLRRERPQTEIIVLDKLTYSGNRANLAEFEGQPGFEFVTGSVEAVDELAARVDAMVNFAAETHVDRSLLSPLEFVDSNIGLVAVLCEAARRHGHEAFLQVSTDEVYGHVPEGRTAEDHPLRPRSPYAASKAGGELLARAYVESFGLPLLVTRGSNTYGPYQYPEKIVPLFITNALDSRPLPIYGDGSAVRDYIFVEDHCRAIDLVLTRGEPGSVYNVGTGVETDGNTVARTVVELMGADPALIQEVADRAGHDYRYALDVRLIRDELGWRPEVDFATGMRKTVDWYRENEAWWRPLKSGEFWEFYRRNYRPAG